LEIGPLGASPVENGASVGASTYEVKMEDLPGFFLFLVVVLGLLVVVVEIGVLVKVFILKDFIVVVDVRTGVHVGL
jgi:hypothetical protein